MKAIFKILIILGIAIAVWFGIRIIDSSSSNAGRDLETPAATQTRNEVPAQSGMKAYSNDELGISFEYPAEYTLDERTINSAQRRHERITLTKEEGAPEGVAGEGPTAITIDIYQNDLDKLSARDFVTGHSDSNYKLGDGNISTSTRGSLTGIGYEWSGLYEGKSFVTATPSFIYHFAVTYISPLDTLLGDFDDLIRSAKIKS